MAKKKPTKKEQELAAIKKMLESTPEEVDFKRLEGNLQKRKQEIEAKALRKQRLLGRRRRLGDTFTDLKKSP